jgi:amidase
MNGLTFRTATELAEVIRNGQISATEVAEAFLAQIAEHNPKLNAVILVDETGVRQRAKEADAALSRGEVWGPLHGVPVTFKDVFETAGMRTTSGHKPLADYVPERDAPVVARLRAAGAIILGKTNTPELAGDIQTNSALLGRANNPWNTDYTTGGSSGGEAAAVAAGLSPLGLGSDLGGSIRFPAHCCGILGLKATDHRTPLAGHIPELPGGLRTVRYMGVVGPLARSVADLRLCFSLIAGPDERDPEVPPVPLSDPPKRPLSELKFAWSDDFGGTPISADTKAALSKLADDLSKAGCQVERKNPPGFDFAAAWETYGELAGLILGSSMPWLQRFGFKLLGPMMFKDPVMGRATQVALGLDVRQYFEALAKRDALIAVLERFLEDYDAWLCPVAPRPAFAHCKPGPVGEPIEVDGQRVPYWMICSAHTVVFNLTGNPAVVLPLTQSAEGLPVGVQVVGPRWGDMALLNVAEALMEVIGPVRHPPGYG